MRTFSNSLSNLKKNAALCACSNVATPSPTNPPFAVEAWAKSCASVVVASTGCCSSAGGRGGRTPAARRAASAGRPLARELMICKW
jgi:hypothetical protein